MKVSIICPLYNAEAYVGNLYESILKQKKVEIEEIKFILTESKDMTETILNEIGACYEIVKKSDFSHSLVREKAALESKGDIVVFITQDIQLGAEDWLEKLIQGIVKGECDASFSRQIGYKNHGLERYIREVNYPKESRIVSKKDVEELGIMTFFFSDASSAIKKEVFVELNGYDGKKLPTNEDMYFAYKLIHNGYRIKYESESIIIHSHEYSAKEVYSRYKSIGRFFVENPHIGEFEATKKGAGVLKYVLKKAIQDKNYKIIIELFVNFSSRFVGMNVGKINK